MIGDRKVYHSLDIAKYVMALMILVGHTANEWAHITGIWHYILAFNFTVPAFFAISGFLFFNKFEQLQTPSEKTAYYRKWSLRIGRMYLIWSIIYILLSILKWCMFGVTIDTIVHSVHRWLVFSTYATIWFLPALWVGGSIIYLMYRYSSKIVLFAVTGILWLTGVIMGAYPGLIKNETISMVVNIYDTCFFTFRNGLFYGSAYFLLGYCCHRMLYKFSLWQNMIGFIIFYLLFFGEAVMMHKLVKGPNTDMALMMLPSVFFMVMAIARIDVPENPFWRALRNQSMLIFCGQRIFLTAIPALLPAIYSQVHTWPSIIIMIFFCVPVVLFAWVLDKLGWRI